MLAVDARRAAAAREGALAVPPGDGGGQRDGCTALSGATPCGWDDFTAAGQWVGEAEYAEDGYVCSPGQQCEGPHSFGTFCRSVYAVPHGFAAVKFDADLDGRIFFSCRE